MKIPVRLCLLFCCLGLISSLNAFHPAHIAQTAVAQASQRPGQEEAQSVKMNALNALIRAGFDIPEREKLEFYVYPEGVSISPVNIAPFVRVATKEEQEQLNVLFDEMFQQSPVGNYRPAVLFAELASRTWGADHPYTMTAEELLLNQKWDNGRNVDALESAERIYASKTKWLGRDHWITLYSISPLANAHMFLEQDREAVLLIEKHLSAVAYNRDVEPLAMAQLLRKLGSAYLSLDETQRASAALTLALDILEPGLGATQHSVVETKNDLGFALYRAGEFAKAKRVLEQTIAEIEADGSFPQGHQGLVAHATALSRLSLVLKDLDELQLAEKRTREAIEIRQSLYSETSSFMSPSYSALATILDAQGRTAEAEVYHRKAIDIDGVNTIQGVTSILNLTSTLIEQDRWTEAYDLFGGVDKMFENLPPLSDERARALLVYAALMRWSGQIDRSTQAYSDAIAIRTRLLGAAHPSTINARDNLALHLLEIGDATEALKVSEAAYKDVSKRANPDEGARALLLMKAGSALSMLGETDRAEAHFFEALQIRNRLYGAAHPDTLNAMTELASNYLDAGKPKKALDYSRDLAQRTGLAPSGSVRLTVGSHQRARAWLLSRSAYEYAQRGGGKSPADQTKALMREGFASAQLVSLSGAGEALARSAARQTADPGSPLSGLARRLDDLRNEVDRIDERYAVAVGMGSEGDELRRALGAKRASAVSEIASVEKRLQTQFPQFIELTQPDAISLSALQAREGIYANLLGEDEVLVLITPGRSSKYGKAWNGLVWAVSKDGAAWAEIGGGETEIRAMMAQLRNSLGSGDRAPDQGVVPRNTPHLVFDRSAARRLYDALFGDPDVRALLSSKENWILVPQGAYVGVPFSALVTGPFSGLDNDPRALRSTPWLGTEKALSILPSVSSLRALRLLERPSRVASEPFFGVGDPDFAGRGDGEQTSQERSGASSQVAPGLEQLARLPATRAEIRALAKSFGVEDQEGKAFLLGSAATEHALRSASKGTVLPNARIVAFATHGLITGDFEGLEEPALALTPPLRLQASDNDGLLTASEAAGLELSADWVILSACNTAAGNGDAGAEGLSGLARAFFYAGADTLLVSNWQVQDRAAERLTTSAIRFADSEGLPRATALQRAMTDLMNDTTRDKSYISNAHPATWAPFMFVGVDQ